jgi:3-oxoacyl-(acyl-carrier-protein) synthase
MDARRTVVVTGIGLIAPTGLGRDAFWTAIRDGRPALGPLTRFDATAFPSRVAGQVPDGWVDAFDPRLRRTAPVATLLLLAAGDAALVDARVTLDAVPPERRAVYVGTALGGWRTGEEQIVVVHERGPRRVNPFLVNSAATYAPGAALATEVGAEGPQATFTSGCPASLQAITAGAGAVADGDVDLALVGGVEWPLCKIVVAGMGRTHELHSGKGDPARASRPFDAAHAGIVLAEGACVLVLEPLDLARARGARPLAAVLGGGGSCDARGLYGSDPDGTAGARAVHAALRRAGRTPAEVGWVCAHANGSPAFDRKEAAVLTRAFGEGAATPPVSSIKGVLGHPLGASGAFQVAAAALALHEALLPPTANLETPAPECTLAHVVGTARPWRPGTALVTSYGYGGVNACLVIGAAE